MQYDHEFPRFPSVIDNRQQQNCGIYEISIIYLQDFSTRKKHALSRFLLTIASTPIGDASYCNKECSSPQRKETLHI